MPFSPAPIDDARAALAGDPALPPPTVDVLALDRALEALGAVDPRKTRVIEMRYFGGMTGSEIAQALA